MVCQGSDSGMHKFMQSLDSTVFAELDAIAEERGISIQELMRAVVLPEWFMGREHVDRGTGSSPASHQQ